MKRFLFICCMLYAVSVAVVAAGNPGFGPRRYAISGMAEYSYNTAWGHHANLDVKALMPINPYFEMEAKVQLSTANVYTTALQLRPKFELPVGELFIETDLLYRAVSRTRIHDMTAALGVGYRMDYVSVTLGMYCRLMADYDLSWYTTDTYMMEPFNLLYRVEVFCRPQANRWNLSFMVSNTDDYQMERQWQPLFGVGAYYDVTDHWRLDFGAQSKPTGMFHLDATFYGATLKAGFTYRF